MSLSGDFGWRLDAFEISQLNKALATDPFFRKLHSATLLSSDTPHDEFQFNTVVAMCYGGQPVGESQDCPETTVAVKFSRQAIFELIGKVNVESLLDIEDKYSAAKNIALLELLDAINAPYIIQQLASRRVLMTSFNPEDEFLDISHKLNVVDEPIIKHVWALEYGDKRDMGSYAETLKKKNTSHLDIVKNAISLLYKMALSLDMTSGISKLLHGDIRLDHIFVRSCSAPRTEDVCPVIGHWDKGLYNPKLEENEVAKGYGTSEELRYSDPYRPPEMVLLRKRDEEGYTDNYVYVGDGGYEYTFKEDVYALGIATLSFLKKSGMELDAIRSFAPLYQLIGSMIWPISLEDIFDIVGDEGLEHRRSLTSGLLQLQSLAHLLALETEEVKNFVANINNVIDDCDIKDIFDEEERFASVFELINYAQEAKRCGLEYIQKNPESVIPEAIIVAIDHLGEINLSRDLTLNRHDMTQVKDRALELLVGILEDDNVGSAGNINNKIEQEWMAHIKEMQKLTVQAENSKYLNVAMVSPQFENLEPEEQSKVCKGIRFNGKTGNKLLELHGLHITEVCSEIAFRYKYQRYRATQMRKDLHKMVGEERRPRQQMPHYNTDKLRIDEVFNLTNKRAHERIFDTSEDEDDSDSDMSRLLGIKKLKIGNQTDEYNLGAPARNDEHIEDQGLNFAMPTPAQLLGNLGEGNVPALGGFINGQAGRDLMNMRIEEFRPQDKENIIGQESNESKEKRII